MSTLLLLTLAFSFSTCSKEYSYEGGPIADTIPTRPVAEASFTLAGDPMECTQGGVNGDFIAGTPVLADNFASVTVIITVPGTYYIATDTIDGFSFFASGTFNTIGSQIVSLKPSGTPLVPRNLVFTPHAGRSGCTFKATVVKPGFPATYVLESGFDNSCTGHVVTGSYTATDALTGSNTVSVKVFVTVPGTYAIVTNTKNGMQFLCLLLFPELMPL